MDEADKAFNTHDPNNPNKNANIAQKGMADMKTADENIGHHHGIKQVPSTGTVAPDANTAPGTSAGIHSVAPGNIGSTGATVGHGPAGGVQEQPGVNQRV